MKVKFTIVRIDPVPVSELPRAEQVGWLSLAGGERVAGVSTRRTGGGDTYLEVLVAEEFSDEEVLVGADGVSEG